MRSRPSSKLAVRCRALRALPSSSVDRAVCGPGWNTLPGLSQSAPSAAPAGRRSGRPARAARPRAAPHTRKLPPEPIRSRTRRNRLSDPSPRTTNRLRWLRSQPASCALLSAAAHARGARRSARSAARPAPRPSTGTARRSGRSATRSRRAPSRIGPVASSKLRRATSTAASPEWLKSQRKARSSKESFNIVRFRRRASDGALDPSYRQPRQVALRSAYPSEGPGLKRARSERPVQTVNPLAPQGAGGLQTCTE